MDERVARLKTPQDCEQFAKNVEEKFPELAREARRRGIKLRAAAHNAQTEVEREALQAVYAYEEVLTAKNGRKTRAARTWPDDSTNPDDSMAKYGFDDASWEAGKTVRLS